MLIIVFSEATPTKQRRDTLFGALDVPAAQVKCIWRSRCQLFGHAQACVAFKTFYRKEKLTRHFETVFTQGVNIFKAYKIL